VFPAHLHTDDGTVWVAWQSYRSGNPDIWYRTSSDGGANWTSASQITTYTGSDYHPSMAETADGKIWVVWYSRRSGNYDIWYKTSSDGGATWSEASQFTKFTGRDRYPAATALSSGELAVTWDSDRAVNYDVWYGVIGLMEDMNPPPYLDWAENEPRYPTTEDGVTVRARASDESGVQDVELMWWLDGISQPNFAMYDDGNHGDWGTGDGIYGVELGPFPTAGTQVEYQVRVTDIDENTIVAPQYPRSFEVIEPFVKTADILVVGDDATEFLPYYTCILDILDYDYDVWDSELRGNLDSDTLNQYLDGIVIWAVPYWGYIGWSETQDNLADYLDTGGRLFISGQNIGRYIGWSDFYREYLHAEYVQDDIDLYALFGVTDDPVTDGLYVSISGGDGAKNQYSPSEIDPIPPAVSIFTYDPGATTALVEPSIPKEEVQPESDEVLSQRELREREKEGVPWDAPSAERGVGSKSIESSGSGALRVDTDDYRVVYFAFGFEAINSAADRVVVMDGVLNWLGAQGSVIEAPRWTEVKTPSEEDWVVAPGSDIYDLAVGPDGDIIYAVGVGHRHNDPSEPMQAQLWKSEDRGVTWDDITKNLPDTFNGAVDRLYFVSVAPDDADLVVVAGWDMTDGPIVYASGDGGDDLTDTAFDVVSDDRILCLDMSADRDDTHAIAVGTGGGELWICMVGVWGGAWKDATLKAGWDSGSGTTTAVTSVAFSSNWTVDDTILAITTDTTDRDNGDTYQQSGLWGTTKAWNDEAGSPFPAAVKIIDAPPYIDDGGVANAFDELDRPTGITLPDDFTGYDSSLRYDWVYVNWDTADSEADPASFDAAFVSVGEVFRIKGSTVKYAGINCEQWDTAASYPLMASISMTGEIEDGNLMVGLTGPTDCCKGIQVYRTAEWPIDYCCPQWAPARKPPTGEWNCVVAYCPDGSKAYAVTSSDGVEPAGDDWDESAFSISEVEEVGKYWNQPSLVDTYIDYLSDVAVNPACGTIYVFSVNEYDDCGCDSVWMSTNDGSSYLRIFCKTLEEDWGLIRLAPEEEEEVLPVYLVDQGTKTIYWNNDSGLTKWVKRKVSTLVDVVDLAVESEDTIYAVSSAGNVSMSDKHGGPGSWSSAEDADLAAVEGGHTIAAVDGHVLVGGDDGSVGYSSDSADSFTRLGDASELGVGGLVHVAFDSYFSNNNTIYAALTGGDQGLWRWVIDRSSQWEDLRATSRDYFGIVLHEDDLNTNANTGGVLYAVYEDGMARWRAPATSPLPSKWEYLENGIPTASAKWDDGFINKPSALKVCGNGSRLWAIDANGYDLEEGENNLFVYYDMGPPSLRTHLLAVTGTSYRTPADLDGGKICLGGQAYFDMAQVALDTYSMDYAIVVVPSGQRLMALKTGIIDAALVTEHPWDAVVADNFTTEVRFLSWSAPAIEAVKEEFPWVGSAQLPANTYPWQIEVVPGYTPLTNPPNTPSEPSPADGAADVPIDADLSWDGGDPDAGDIVTYDVYFGTNSTPPFKETIGPYAANQTSMNYTLETLSYNTTYYWQIVASDNHGVTKEGPLWHFTTEAEITITGVTGEVNCDTLSEVTVELYKDETLIDSTTSGGDGNYTLPVPELGDYEVVASKSGFRDETQTLDITELGQQYELNFRGETGLIPDAPDVFYVLECVNHWLFPVSPCGLTVFKVLEVVNAWLFPTM